MSETNRLPFRLKFKIAHDGGDAFYELSFDVTDSANFAYGTSLDAMDNVIVCN